MLIEATTSEQILQLRCFLSLIFKPVRTTAFCSVSKIIFKIRGASQGGENFRQVLFFCHIKERKNVKKRKGNVKKTVVEESMLAFIVGNGELSWPSTSFVKISSY